MALVPKFKVSDIVKKLQIDKERIIQAAINRMRFVGERFIIHARSTDTYKDRTGNLRASIGYVILLDGQQLFDNFPGATETGRDNGKQVAADAAANEFPSGLVLICVAGMQYAGYVESRNYDVITGSALIAEDEMRKSFAELEKKLLAA